MVLDDVAGGADAVVVSGAGADADVLGHRDLDVVDVGGVPQRLVQLVGKAQRHEVLHRFFAEIVVDAEDRVLVEDFRDHVVELASRFEIVPEGLFDDDAPPPVVLGAKPGRSDPAEDGREQLGRNRQVKGVIAVGSALGGHLVHRMAEGTVGLDVVVLAVDDHEPGHELLERRLGDGGVRALAYGGLDFLRQRRVDLSGDADDCERRRKQPAVGEIVERRKNFSTRQVACDAEKDDSTRARDSLQAAVGCAAKRIDHRLSTFPEIDW